MPRWAFGSPYDPCNGKNRPIEPVRMRLVRGTLTTCTSRGGRRASIHRLRRGTTAASAARPPCPRSPVARASRETRPRPPRRRPAGARSRHPDSRTQPAPATDSRPRGARFVGGRDLVDRQAEVLVGQADPVSSDPSPPDTMSVTIPVRPGLRGPGQQVRAIFEVRRAARPRRRRRKLARAPGCLTSATVRTPRSRSRLIAIIVRIDACRHRR